MVTASALAVLHEVATTTAPRTTAELVEATGYSAKQVHRALAALTATGELSQRRGVQNRKELTPGPGRLMTAYQRLLSDAGHVDWSALLRPALLRVAWFLDSPTRISAIADRLHVTPQAVYRSVDPQPSELQLTAVSPTTMNGTSTHSKAPIPAGRFASTQVALGRTNYHMAASPEICVYRVSFN